MILLPKGLFGFQEACAGWLTETVAREDSRQTLVVKAPTGAGKTIILIDFIDRYLSRENANTVFVWLCPGKGDLEEQSRQKMQKLLPGRPARTLADALQLGFAPGSTVFINWELVTKRGNRAIGEGERKNLYDRVVEAKRRGTEFVIIIDEEHSNDTKKAAGLLEAVGPRHIVRVSATAKTHRLCEFYEIDEREVIAAGLITKALYINEDVDYNGHFESEHGYLIALADKKRQDMPDVKHAERIVLCRDMILGKIVNHRNRRQRIERQRPAVRRADQAEIEIPAANPERKYKKMVQHGKQRTPCPGRQQNLPVIRKISRRIMFHNQSRRVARRFQCGNLFTHTDRYSGFSAVIGDAGQQYSHCSSSIRLRTAATKRSGVNLCTAL